MNRTPVAPTGSAIRARLFTRCGNHDLYFGGDALLKTLELIEQPGRYLLIETKHWRIACLDTSLAAPGIGRLEGKLDQQQLKWLEDTIAANDPRPLILMSHHFTVSAWDEPSELLQQQIGNLVKGKVLAWYWGHDTRAARYGLGPHGFYGACAGNGAFIEMLDKPDPKRNPTPEWYSTAACDCFGKENPYWSHGFVELQLEPTRLVETFILERGESSRREMRIA